jgi:hypothetical protein
VQDAADEQAELETSAGPEPTADEPGYSSVGERVAEILRAAEAAAEGIRRDAQAEAARIRRDADAAAHARIENLARDAERARDEAEEYARDLRLAVEAYATKHRQQAEEEAREVLPTAQELGIPMPSPTLKPLVAGFGLAIPFIGLIWHVKLAVMILGGAVFVITLFSWLLTPVEPEHH